MKPTPAPRQKDTEFMGPLFLRCQRAALLAAALLYLPAATQAAGPVEQLRDALKIDPAVPGKADPDLKIAATRNKLIEAILPELKTVSQLRRAYFLSQWSQGLKDDDAPKILDVDRYRIEIGEKLAKAI